MSNNKNMMCDINTGICGETDGAGMEMMNFQRPQKKIDLYYVTDPICSHCWALEPVLRRFTEQYGDYFRFHTVIGGLLEKWHDGPIDPANGIYQPADVVKHWREVGEHYRMPIDGSLMKNDHVESSYPASRVFTIIQKHHGAEVASSFLRRAREALFIFNQNIGKDEVLIEIASKMDLDGKAMVDEANQTIGQTLLSENFDLTKQLGARGFPTIVMINEENQGIKLVGNRSLEDFVQALEKILANTELQASTLPSLESILKKEKMLFAREIEVLYDLHEDELASFIEKELDANAYKRNEVLGEVYLTYNY
ncbi:DsbA family protein [Gracilibacillus kekensis]|uniref:Predicted dithiol-disulfide isomerase, DsbA family n=1 Tax=Gracilibacillus kekensis TaxID=1027249 RepID=A0A1M7L8E6_9BACI|nr:DsbA family protein [Gracilibacillus kekensis]SHM74227.1 Predicted dithiol-disulfide isomerase, DsbA family [Gracilibacillus kekensis]